MALQGWKKEFSVNHPIMDADHQKLVEMISSLYEAMKLGKSRDVLEKNLNSMTKYAKEHLMREENYLISINFPDLNNHQQQHQLFLQKVEDLTTNFGKGNMAIAVDMLPFLNQWFMNHIMIVDKKYSMK